MSSSLLLNIIILKRINIILNIFTLFNISVFNTAVITQIKITDVTSEILLFINILSVAALTLIVRIIWSFLFQDVTAWTYQNILWSFI
jgi:hypothetical protein